MNQTIQVAGYPVTIHTRAVDNGFRAEISTSRLILLALFLLGIFGTLASAANASHPATTSDSAWPEPGNPVPPYDK
jgi:hypothetical protein